MADIHSNPSSQGSREKSDGANRSWRHKVLESMDVAGEAIIDFAKNPFARPKYLTALAGFLALLGTILPWTFAGGFGIRQDFAYTGFTLPLGQVIAVSGLAIILLAIFRRTRPGRANSLASSLLALIAIVITCVLWASTVFCVDCGALKPGVGNILSVLALFLTFVLGLIPNPKQAVTQ